jgi:hypothetical protein
MCLILVQNLSVNFSKFVKLVWLDLDSIYKIYKGIKRTEKEKGN